MPLLSVEDLKTITRIKERRGDDVESPGTLEKLALRAIAESLITFVASPVATKKIIRKMPPTLVQKALEGIYTETDGDDFYLVRQNEDVIFQLFLDERTTTLNGEKFFYDKKLLNHLSTHCPNLMSFTGEEDRTPCPALPTISRIRNWRNLEVLHLQGYALNDRGALLIRQNVPKLRELQIDLDEGFTMVGVEHLANMDDLSCLDLRLDGVEKTQEIVAMAGNIKKLKKFNHRIFHQNASEHYSEFLLLLRALYPEKELTMDYIILKAPFIWPPNLKATTAYLEFDKQLIDGALDHVFMIRTDTVMLSVKGRTSDAMIYSLLENFGPKVTAVEIEQLECVLKLDLSRVFANCPNLSKFTFCSAVNLKYPFSCKIGPTNFAKIESFDAHSDKPAAEGQELSPRNAAVMNRLLKFFAMGCVSCSTLCLRSISEVKTIMEAMKESSSALSTLNDITVVVSRTNTEDCETITKFLLKLMRRCVKMSDMRISSWEDGENSKLEEKFRCAIMYAQLIGIDLTVGNKYYWE